MEEDLGSVEYEGKTLNLTQFPYISDCGNYYDASATDNEENIYQISWPIINPDCEDESEACDWEDFEVELLYKEND